jgi:hypothetical protein
MIPSLLVSPYQKLGNMTTSFEWCYKEWQAPQLASVVRYELFSALPLAWCPSRTGIVPWSAAAN